MSSRTIWNSNRKRTRKDPQTLCYFGNKFFPGRHSRVGTHTRINKQGFVFPLLSRNTERKSKKSTFGFFDLIFHVEFNN
uniref:Uncharacterized protein n=1 Tax=Leptospira ellisii TaxID=2023197 RepID=A0A2N0BDF7_9LEPT|nr:hypothetical protein CH379_01850 [Leptospira ellisii]